MTNPYYKGPATDHFDGERFFQPGLASSDRSFFDVLRWRLLERRAGWPEVVPARSGLRPEEVVDDLVVTLVGHASLLIQTAGINMLIDPVWAERASPFRWAGPRRRNPPAIAFDDLPPIHAVLITHDHYDHLDVTIVSKLWKAYRPVIISPLGNDAVIHVSVPDAAVKTGDWWDSFSLSGQVRATIVPAYHWSARRFGDRRMALWGGFVLETPAGAIYCAGDTAYRDGKIFREIGRRFGPPRVAIVPIGAYAPRWFMQNQHADPAEALQIALDCGARQVLGIHWGTFPLTDEPWHEPEELLQAAVRTERVVNVGVQAMRAGDVWCAD